MWANYNVYEDILGRKSLVHAQMKETQAWWQGRDEEIIRHYLRDIVELVNVLELDIVAVEELPLSQYMLMGREGGFRRPMRKVDDETYEDNDGSLWRVSSATRELLPYRPNPASYTAPTLESLEKDIDEVDRNGVEKPEAWAWKVVRHVVAEMKDTHFILCQGPDIGIPSFGQTMEESLVNLARHPEMHAKIAELAGKRAIASLPHYAEQGVDGLIGGADWGTSTGMIVNPGIFVEHVYPWLKAYCEEAHRLGLKVIKHCCGRTLAIFDYFIKAGFDAYQAIQPTAGMDIRLLKERYGEKLTLWGGVSVESLIGGTPADIEEEARYAIRWAAPGAGYIYGSSHSLPVGVRRENVLAMKAARDRLGIYPIGIQ
jgi:hypothetical protein